MKSEFKNVVDNWFLYLAVYSSPPLFSTEKYQMVHAMFTQPQTFIQQSFHREIYEGETQAAEDAGR